MKQTINIREIDKSVEDHKCPGYYWCTVATTGYDAHTRERMCLRCWLEVMNERNIEVVYDEEVNE